MKEIGNVYLSSSLHQIICIWAFKGISAHLILQQPRSVNTLVVIYLYCPSAQRGSVCPWPSWVTCRRTSRAQHREKNQICLWVFPVPQHRHLLLVFIIVIFSISANIMIIVSSVLKPTSVDFTSHPPSHLTVRSSTFPKPISTPFLSLLFTNHILFLLSWILFLCWEKLRFWTCVRSTDHHRSSCRHINLPESHVRPGTHTCIHKTQQSYSWKCCIRLHNSTVFSKTLAPPQFFPCSPYYHVPWSAQSTAASPAILWPYQSPGLLTSFFSFCSLEFKLFSSPFRSSASSCLLQFSPTHRAFLYCLFQLCASLCPTVQNCSW